MSRKQEELECLSRLCGFNGMDEILTFLVTEKLTDDVGIKTITQASDKVKELHLLLTSLSLGGKFQLLEYVWNVLPKEIIVLTIVTDRAKKEFNYSSF